MKFLELLGIRTLNIRYNVCRLVLRTGLKQSRAIHWQSTLSSQIKKSKSGLFCLVARMLDCTGETTISIMSVYLRKLALTCKHAENIL